MLISLFCFLLGCVTIETASVCENGGGQCLNKNTNTCDNGFVTGKCPGAAHIQCCYDCKNHDGLCQSDSISCPGGYVSGSCNGPSNIRCCLSTASSACASGGGECRDENLQGCTTGFETGLCPGAANIKCCYPSACESQGGDCKNAARDSCNSLFQSGLCPGASYMQCCKSGTGCGSESQQLACDIQNNQYITLATSHPSGVTDDAYASLNIQDVCNGQQAKRSSYSSTCPGGVAAPGGATCLHKEILEYVLAIANLNQHFKVNEFAGACHSSQSKHYEGRAVDLAITSSTTTATYQSWMSLCVTMGGFALGPGDPGHSSHVHCQI